MEDAPLAALLGAAAVAADVPPAALHLAAANPAEAPEAPSGKQPIAATAHTHPNRWMM